MSRYVAAILVLIGLVAVAASGASAAGSLATKVVARRKPAINSFRYGVIRASGGQRVLSFTAVVSQAQRCFVYSPRLTGRRKRAWPCSKQGRLPLVGALSAEAFTARVTIEAVSRRGVARATFLVRVVSAAAEREIERERQQEAERHAHEASERGQAAARTEREEREHREATEREEREQKERGQRSREASASTLRIAGVGAMVGLVEDLAGAYRNAGFKTEFQISKLADGSAGITAVAEGEDEIGLSSRDPIPGVDPPGLVFTKIAAEEVCLVTNDANSLGNLNEETIDGIFTGKLHSWSEVPGATVAGTIDPFDYEPATPAQEAFQRIFLGEYLGISGATVEPSEELLRSAVAADPQAVGFVRDSQATGVNSVDYEGVPCTVETARSGEYSGARSLWLVTKGPPSGESLTFIDWIEESPEATNVIESNWITVW